MNYCKKLKVCRIQYRLLYSRMRDYKDRKHKHFININRLLVHRYNTIQYKIPHNFNLVLERTMIIRH